MRPITRLLPFALALISCGSVTVPLDEVDGSGVRGVVTLSEAVTKSFGVRVDAFVELDQPPPAAQAALMLGPCADPGAPLQSLSVHPRGVGGAAEVVLPDGRLGDLTGSSIHVYAGEPGASPRLACGAL